MILELPEKFQNHQYSQKRKPHKPINSLIKFSGAEQKYCGSIRISWTMGRGGRNEAIKKMGSVIHKTHPKSEAIKLTRL